MKTPSIHVLGTSQNLGANSTVEQQFVSITPIPSSQALITMDLTTDGPPDNRSTDFMNYDKLSALEERLRVVEGNDWFDPMRAAKVCLVSNIIVPKNFRIPEFIKYILRGDVFAAMTHTCDNHYTKRIVASGSMMLVTDQFLIFDPAPVSF